MIFASVAGPIGVGFLCLGMVLGSGGSQAWNFIGAICLVLGFALVAPDILSRW